MLHALGLMMSAVAGAGIALDGANNSWHVELT
jgi:hypothetical protein